MIVAATAPAATETAVIAGGVVSATGGVAETTRKWSIIPVNAGAGEPEFPTKGPIEVTVIA